MVQKRQVTFRNYSPKRHMWLWGLFRFVFNCHFMRCISPKIKWETTERSELIMQNLRSYLQRFVKVNSLPIHCFVWMIQKANHETVNTKCTMKRSQQIKQGARHRVHTIYSRTFLLYLCCCFWYQALWFQCVKRRWFIYLLHMYNTCHSCITDCRNRDLFLGKKKNPFLNSWNGF